MRNVPQDPSMPVANAVNDAYELLPVVQSRAGGNGPMCTGGVGEAQRPCTQQHSRVCSCCSRTLTGQQYIPDALLWP